MDAFRRKVIMMGAFLNFGWCHIITVFDSQMILSLESQRRKDFLSTLLDSVPGPEN